VAVGGPPIYNIIQIDISHQSGSVTTSRSRIVNAVLRFLNEFAIDIVYNNNYNYTVFIIFIVPIYYVIEIMYDRPILYTNNKYKISHYNNLSQLD